MNSKYQPGLFFFSGFFRCCVGIGVVCLFLESAGVMWPPYTQAEPTEQPSSAIRDQAEERLRLGVDFFLTHELDVAIDEFREAARLYSGYADAFHNLGVALAKTGKLKGAIAAWTKAQRLDPGGVPCALPYIRVGFLQLWRIATSSAETRKGHDSMEEGLGHSTGSCGGALCVGTWVFTEGQFPASGE